MFIINFLAVCLLAFCGLGSCGPSFPAMWKDTKLDHFNPTDTRTFAQKYFINSQYFKGGPIFLYINGEGPATAPPYQNGSEVVALASQFQGLIVSPEHRFFGDSQPFSSLTADNLEYLTVSQALADLADFVEFVRTKYYGGDAVPVVTIGGSYSGALSAWFRLKYPQLTVGSISSSGVVHAIQNFTAFDEYVASAAGPTCADALRDITGQFETAWQADPVGTASQFVQGGSLLVDPFDFFYFLADSMAESVQYGYQEELCSAIVGVPSSLLIATYVNYTNSFWTPIFGGPAGYATSQQQNVSANSPANADRAWWWMTCMELAYWQVAPDSGSIRSQVVDFEGHAQHCLNVFGVPANLDGPDQTTVTFGDNNTIAATNVVYFSGSQDPWSQACVLDQLRSQPSTTAFTIDCPCCGHCMDLSSWTWRNPPTCNWQLEVQIAQAIASEYVQVWLDEYYVQL